MFKFTCSCAAFAGVVSATVTSSQAALFSIVLLDAENKRLDMGDAVIFAYSPASGWTVPIGFLPNEKIYREQLPKTDVVNLAIYSTRDNLKMTVSGLYGRQNHTLYLRVDEVGTARCAAGPDELGVPFEIIEMLNDLDEAYPRGLPKSKTNTRKFLREFVEPMLREAESEVSPERRAELLDLNNQLNRHLNAS